MAPPINDNFASATAITAASGSISGTTFDATKEASESTTIGTNVQSVWYKFTAPSTGDFKFWIHDSDATYHGVFGFDSRSISLRVFPDGVLTAMTLTNEITDSFNDSTNHYDAEVIFSATSGTSYYIRVSSAGTGNQNTADFTLHWEQPSPPANDNLASATNVGSIPVSLTGETTYDASFQSSEVVASSSFGVDKEQSVWYTFTPATTGKYRFKLENISRLGNYGNSSAILQISTQSTLAGYTPANELSGTRLTVSLFTTPISQTATYADLTSGTTYYIRVSTPWDYKSANGLQYNGSAIDFDLIIDAISPPANDDFANAEVLSTTLPGTTTGDLYDSTEDSGQSTSFPFSSGDQSVWYSFTPSVTGPYKFVIPNSTLVYTGDNSNPNNGFLGFDISAATTASGHNTGAIIGGPSFVDYAETDDGLMIANLNAGTTYIICVHCDGTPFNNDTMQFDLNYDLAPIPSNDDFDDRITITGTSGTENLSCFYASYEASEPPPYYWWDGFSNGNVLTVWYEWTCPSTNWYKFDILTNIDWGNSDYTLSVYTGSSLGSLTLVSGNEAGGEGQSPYENSPKTTLGFHAIAGTSYKIQVGTNRSQLAFRGDSDADLTWNTMSAPSGDTTGTAELVTGTGIDGVRVDNYGNTDDELPPNALTRFSPHDNNYYTTPAFGRSKWWKYVATTNGTLHISYNQYTSGGGAYSENAMFAYKGANFASLTDATTTNAEDAVLSGYQGFATTINGDEFMEIDYLSGETIWLCFVGTYDADTTYYTSVVPEHCPQTDFDLTISSEAPPVNDNFANRINLGGSYVISTTGSTALATTEASEPNTNPGNHNPPYPSVWYEWTSLNTDNEPLDFIFDTSGSSADTWLEIFTGNSLGSLVLIDSDHGSGFGGDAEITLSTNGGINYKIRVSSPTGSQGDFNLNITAQTGTPPANDDFANAELMTGYSDSVTGTTAGATSEIGEPAWSIDDAALNTVWYKWTPPQTGRLRIGFESDTGPGITFVVPMRGTDFSNLVEVQDGIIGSDSTFNNFEYFSVEGGVQYYFAVMGNGGIEDTFTLSIAMSSASPPVNDDPENAIVLDTDILTGNIDGTTEGANWDSIGPNTGDFTTNAEPLITVWWKFVAPRDGSIRITANSETIYEPSYTTDMSPTIYRGSNISTAAGIDSTAVGQPIINAFLEQGETYWISVETYSWTTSGDIDYAFIWQEDNTGGFNPDPSSGTTADFDSVTGTFVADDEDGEYVASGGSGLGYGTIEPWTTRGTHHPYAWYCRFEVNSTQGDYIYRYGQSQQYIEIFRATKVSGAYAGIGVKGHYSGVQELIVIDDSGATLYDTNIDVWGAKSLGTSGKVRIELGPGGVVIDGKHVELLAPGSAIDNVFADSASDQFIRFDFGIRSYPSDGTSYVDIDPEWNFRYSNIRIHDDPQQDIMGGTDITVKEISSIHGFTTGIDYPYNDSSYEFGSFHFMSLNGKPDVVVSPGEYDGYAIDCTKESSSLYARGYSITRPRNTNGGLQPINSGFDSLFPGFSFRFYVSEFPSDKIVISLLTSTISNGCFLSLDENGTLYIRPSINSEDIPFCTVNENQWNYIEIQADTSTMTYAAKIWLQNRYMGRFESTFTPNSPTSSYPVLPRWETYIVGSFGPFGSSGVESFHAESIGIYFRDLAVTRRKIDRPLGPTVIVPININEVGNHKITEQGELPITQTDIAVNGDFSGSVDGAGQPNHWTGYDRHDTSVPSGAINTGWLFQAFGDTLLSVVSETSGPAGLESDLAMRIEIPTQNDINDDTPAAAYMFFPEDDDGELLDYADVFGAVFWIKGPAGRVMYADAGTGQGYWPIGNFINITGEWQLVRLFPNPNTILAGEYFHNIMYRFDGTSVGDVFYMKDFHLYRNPDGDWSEFLQTTDGGTTVTEITEGETSSWQLIDEIPVNTGGSSDHIYMNSRNFYPTVRGEQDDGKTHLPPLVDDSYLEYKFGGSDADSLYGVRILVQIDGYNGKNPFSSSLPDYESLTSGRVQLVMSDGDGNYRHMGITEGQKLIGIQVPRPPTNQGWTLGKWNDSRIRFGMHDIILDWGVDGLTYGAFNVGVIKGVMAEALVYDRKLSPPNCVRPIDLSRVRFRAYEEPTVGEEEA